MTLTPRETLNNLAAQFPTPTEVCPRIARRTVDDEFAKQCIELMRRCDATVRLPNSDQGPAVSVDGFSEQVIDHVLTLLRPRGWIAAIASRSASGTSRKTLILRLFPKHDWRDPRTSWSDRNVLSEQ